MNDPATDQQDDRQEEWARELFAAAEEARIDPGTSTSQQFWDQLREDRS
jgi:hypothetical protein